MWILRRYILAKHGIFCNIGLFKGIPKPQPPLFPHQKDTFYHRLAAFDFMLWRKMTSEKNDLMRSLEGFAGLLLFSLWRVFFFLVVLLSFLYPPGIPKQLPDFKPQLMWETLPLPELHSVFSSVKKGLTHCLAMTTLTSVSYYYQINLHLIHFSFGYINKMVFSFVSISE